MGHKWMKRDINISIEEVNTSNGLEYDIVFEGDGDIYTVVKCWDYLLAEKLRDTVSEYMGETRKVVGKEDAEALNESFDEPIMPDKAVAGKPIAVKVVYASDPKSAITIHSLSKCVDDNEADIFKKVMATGKAYEDDDIVAVPVLQRGVQKKYRELLHKFSI